MEQQEQWSNKNNKTTKAEQTTDQQERQSNRQWGATETMEQPEQWNNRQQTTDSNRNVEQPEQQTVDTARQQQQ
jgi:hypothetical protein